MEMCRRNSFKPGRSDNSIGGNIEGTSMSRRMYIDGFCCSRLAISFSKDQEIPCLSIHQQLLHKILMLIYFGSHIKYILSHS